MWCDWTTGLIGFVTARPQMWKNKVKHSQPKLAVGCDEACMYGVLCGIVQCPA